MNDLNEIKLSALEIRKLTLLSIYSAKSGHPGGSLSCADILASIYSRIFHGVSNTGRVDRDHFILSKGHAAPALYAAAAVFNVIEYSELKGLRKLGAKNQGHPHIGTTPWVEASTGSLGQGFSVSMGMALGLKYQGVNSSVFSLLGDGEMQEGEVWESLMSAAHFKLYNLCAILDYNKLQSDDTNIKTMNLEPLVDKIKAFGWNVISIDGNNLEAIDSALNEFRENFDKPTFIIAHTIKGAGVDFMENKPEWHGSVKLTLMDLKRGLTSLGFSESQCDEYISEYAYDN